MFVMRNQLRLWYIRYMERGHDPLTSPLIFSLKGYTGSTPTHNTSGLVAATPISPSVITPLMKACWCVILPHQQQQHSCVWYSVGGIHCSAFKFMDQVCWLPSTMVCYNLVTHPHLNMSAVFSTQLLRPWTSALMGSGLLKMRPAHYVKLTRLFCSHLLLKQSTEESETLFVTNYQPDIRQHCCTIDVFCRCEEFVILQLVLPQKWYK